MVTQNFSQQQLLENRLRQLLAEGIPRDKTVEALFGPIEDWQLRLGDQRLLLHPVTQLWYYFDRAHQSWESTGIGPGEVVFVVHQGKLGYRRARPETLPPPEAPAPASPEKPETDSTMMGTGWFLTIKNGPRAGEVFPLGVMAGVGRDQVNEIHIKGQLVSRRHARLEWVGQAYRLTDLNSVNGTFVNGRKITRPVMLKAGDVINIGGTELAPAGR